MELDRHGGESSDASPASPSPGPGSQPRSRRLHPFFQDVSVTLLAQVCVAAGGLLLARLLARNAGADGFASYSLVKQAANILFPIVTVGLVGGLPRYLALPAERDTPSSGTYLIAAAAICWGASEYVLPFALLLAATSTFYIAYGYFRGLLRLRAGSLLQVAALAALPPAVVAFLPDEPVDRLIVLMAVGTAILSLAAIAVPMARGLRSARRASLEQAGRSLWGYGHRRVPGEIAQLGLFVLVPVLAAHVASLREVAYLSAGQQILSIVSLAVLPLGLVLLPSLTRMWAEDRQRTAEHVAQLSSFAASVALFASIQAILYAEIAVTDWLGPEFEDAGSVLTVTVAPTALFVVYLMLRSPLDAVAVKSYNSRNNLIALAVFIASAALLLGFELTDPALAVAWAFAAGVTAQGALTFLTVHRFFAVRWRDYGFPYTVPIALATGAIALLARPAIDEAPSSLLLLLGLEAVLAALYFGAIALSPVAWPKLLAARLFSAAR